MTQNAPDACGGCYKFVTTPAFVIRDFFLCKINGLTGLNHRQPVRSAGNGFDPAAPQSWSTQPAARGETETKEGLKEGLAGTQLGVR